VRAVVVVARRGRRSSADRAPRQSAVRRPRRARRSGRPGSPQSERPPWTCLAPYRRPTSSTAHARRARCNRVIKCVRRVTGEDRWCCHRWPGHQPGNGGQPGWWPKKHRAVSRCGDVRYRGCHPRCHGTVCGRAFRSPPRQSRAARLPRNGRAPRAPQVTVIANAANAERKSVDTVWNPGLLSVLPTLGPRTLGFRRVSGPPGIEWDAC
jgi:hypothetical protein